MLVVTTRTVLLAHGRQGGSRLHAGNETPGVLRAVRRAVL
jgi:hypothetical protein